MIQTIGHYGSLNKPEIQRQIEIIENPLEVVHVTYQLWLPIVRGSGSINKFIDPNSFDGKYELNECENLYQEAVKLLSPYAEVFRNVKQRDLDNILAEVKDSESSASGLYLSALLNVTNLQQLDSRFNHEILGYRLAPGKTLILREWSKVCELGRNAQGNIVNFGATDYMAQNVEKGIQINYGSVSKVMGFQSGGGIQINYNLVNDLAFSAGNGIQINVGKVEMMANGVYGGVQINTGNVGNSMAVYPQDKCVQVNWGKINAVMGSNEINLQQFNFGEANIDETISYNDSRKKVNPLLGLLETKIREIELFKDLKDDEAIDTINGYDWVTFEKEVLSLKEQIEEALR